MDTDPTNAAHPFPNRLGILGWLGKGRHGVERYLYTLHRITGLALLLFLIFHVFVTSSRLLGREVWQSAMSLAHHPVLQWAEFLVFLAFAFHACNGIRLILVELGFAVGAPAAPVYPYRGSLAKQRPLMIALMILAGLLMLTGGFEFLWLDR